MSDNQKGPDPEDSPDETIALVAAADANAAMEAKDAEIDRLRAACKLAAAPDQHAVALELERLMLVIESAVRHSDPRNHAAVLALIIANKAAVKRAVGAAERSS